MKHQRWNDIEHEELSPGIARRVLHGDGLTVARIYLKKGAIVPLHSHHNEQLSYVLEGRLRFDFPNHQQVVAAGEMMQISANGYTNGFSVSGSFLHIKGLEIKNVPMMTNSNNGMSASGSNNIYELLDFHHNNGTGLFISGGMGGNLILNCDSHDNYDPTSSQGDGQNADGSDNEHEQRRRDDGLRAEPVVEKTTKRGANRAGDGEDDAEQAKLGRAPAEHARGIDAAEGEDGAEPVGIKHPRDEEERDLPVFAIELLDPLHELRDAGAHRRLRARGRRPVRREQKQRQHEDEIPERGEWSDQAVALAGCRVERQKRRQAEQSLAGVVVSDKQPGENN